MISTLLTTFSMALVTCSCSFRRSACYCNSLALANLCSCFIVRGSLSPPPICNLMRAAGALSWSSWMRTKVVDYLGSCGESASLSRLFSIAPFLPASGAKVGIFNELLIGIGYAAIASPNCWGGSIWTYTLDADFGVWPDFKVGL